MTETPLPPWFWLVSAVSGQINLRLDTARSGRREIPPLQSVCVVYSDVSHGTVDKA